MWHNNAVIHVYFMVIHVDLMPSPKEQIRYAKDCKCTRCQREGKDTQAVVFVGLNDPDGTDYPMCRKHADEWKMELIIALQGGLN